MARNGKLDLVGTWEAAEILGVERPRIGRWLKPWRTWLHGDEEYIESGGKRGVPPKKGQEPEIKMPKPIADLKSGPVWHRRDIVRFAKKRQAETRERELVEA